jgi:hypothetical protein
MIQTGFSWLIKGFSGAQIAALTKKVYTVDTRIYSYVTEYKFLC